MRRGTVEIIGYSVEPYRDRTSLSSEEIGFLVARRAREMAGAGRDEITSVHNSTMDLFDGITISNGLLQPAAGGYARDCTRIQNGGVFALVSACAAVASGGSSLAVVTSADAVQTDTGAVSVFSSHPLFDQPFQFGALTSYALFSTAVLEERRYSPDLRARVASRNYRAGARNPAAHLRTPHTPEDVASSEMTASPLRRLEVALQSSAGGAAVVVAGASADRQTSGPVVSVQGVGMATSSNRFEHLVELLAVKEAAHRAYRMAGIEDPARTIDLAEVNAPFSVYELALCEALGLGSAEQAGDQGPSPGKYPDLNPSGGTLCTHARNSGGLFRVAEAVRRLCEMPPDRPATALVHDSDASLGLGGDSHAVLILKREAEGA